MVHQPVSRGLAVFAGAWLSGWLAEISADLWENGSALKVVLHDYALYKSTFILLTLLYWCHHGSQYCVFRPVGCLQKEMETCRHWSVFLQQDSDDVPHCWILSSDRIQQESWVVAYSSCTLQMRRCFLTDQLWFVTRIREEEEEGYI